MDTYKLYFDAEKFSIGGFIPVYFDEGIEDSWLKIKEVIKNDGFDRSDKLYICRKTAYMIAEEILGIAREKGYNWDLIPIYYEGLKNKGEFEEIEKSVTEHEKKRFDKMKSGKENVGRGEMVNHPKHYNTNCPKIIHNGEVIEIECIDVIRDMPTWKGNTIKYLWRCGEKEEQGMSIIEKEIEDCHKAIWYIKDHLEQLEKIKNKE